jgi:PAS domain S-box-containing protein
MSGADEGASHEGHEDDAPSYEWLHKLPMGACACDSSGRVRDYNRKARHLLGEGLGSGKMLSSFWSANTKDSEFLKCLARGETVSTALRYVRSGERLKGLLVSAEPTEDADGQFDGFIVTLQPDPCQQGRDDEAPPSLLEVLPVAVYTTDQNGVLTYYNQAAADLWGLEPELGTTMWCGSWKLYHPDGRFMLPEECPMAETIQKQEAVRGREVVVETPGGSRVAIMPYPSPLFDSTGTFVGAVNTLVDISHEKIADERHTLFARELNHRVKNALATVYAIAMQTLRYTETADEFRESFGARLLALSRAHDLLVHSQWQETSLKSILSEALVSFSASRVQLEGDDVPFGPRATLTLAMTFHELVANATMFGALSTGAGKVRISWTVVPDEEEELVQLDWRESGGPEVLQPEQTGFGTRLIQHNVMALGGKATLAYEREGLHCVMRFPVIAEH